MIPPAGNVLDHVPQAHHRGTSILHASTADSAVSLAAHAHLAINPPPISTALDGQGLENVFKLYARVHLLYETHVVNLSS